MSVALGDVAQFINGFAFKPGDWHDDGVPIVRIQNLTDPSKPINRTMREVDDKFRVRPGELLVSWSATLGVFVWDSPESAWVNQHIFRVVPNKQLIDFDYLKHALNSALADMKQHLHGATMLHVNRGAFLATEIPLPTLPEQRRIAAILDQADALRSMRRQAVTHLDELVQAVFHEQSCGVDEATTHQPLSDVVEQIDSGKSPVCQDRPAENDEWGVLKLGAVTYGTFDDSQNKALVDGDLPVRRNQVAPGDLLFSRKNTIEHVGASAYVRRTRSQLLLSDLIFRLVPREDRVDPVYLHRYLMTAATRDRVRALASGSAASMSNISKAKLLAFEIELPPIAAQREFALRTEAILDVLDHLENELAKLDQLFASLQHLAFSEAL